MDVKIIKIFSHSKIFHLCSYSCIQIIFLIICEFLEVLNLEHMKYN